MTTTDDLTPSKKEIVKVSLTAIYHDRGRLTPADVLEEAADANHPLHDYFEWNDEAAAHRHRLVQARGLIRSVKINVIRRTDSGEYEELRVRSWMAMRNAGDETAPPGYVPESELRDDPDRQAILLKHMQRELISLRRRYGHLQKFWELVNEELVAQAPPESQTG